MPKSKSAAAASAPASGPVAVYADFGATLEIDRSQLSKVGSYAYVRDIDCPRCDGSGWYQLNRFERGVCFRCGGARKVSARTVYYTAEARDKRAAAAQAKHDAKRAAEEAARSAARADWDRLAAVDEGIALIIAQARPEGADFLASLVAQGQWRGGLSPVQYAKGVEVARARAEAAASRAQDARTSRHVGSKGDKLEREITIVRIFSHDSKYGTRYTSILRDTDGNLYVWRSQDVLWHCPDSAFGGSTCAPVGTRALVSMRVKDHTEYQGTAQTEVTHAKVLRTIPAVETPAA